MSLSAGTRLGPYEIVGAIGAGGMGEVYRATDTNLRRQVAVKVLPQTVAADPERLARFQREAEVLAVLNHPNIAHIHGLEDAGGVRALVMELVEGPTLADRIAQGPIPIDEALQIAKQIAEALDAAHELGIIHRDLKPSNIKLRLDGVVKVLDFGLAKAVEGTTGSVDAMNSPTITSPLVLTGVGVILGTAAYMAPEQAKGRPVGKRADVWAFGCVLYEMLTGARAFAGDDVQDTLASVLARGPDWKKLPAQTPVAIERLLRRCLEKDLSKRLRDIGDARLDITDALAGGSEAGHVASAAPAAARWLTPRRVVVAGIVFGVIVASLTFTIVRQLSNGVSYPPLVQRLSMTFPAAAPLYPNVPQFALSPDGKSLAYVGAGTRLWFRALDEPEPRELPGTEGAWNPFFSPDGEWIGYVAGGAFGGGFLVRPGQLKKVAIRGGAPVSLSDAVALGASWGHDDTIIFSRQIDHGVALFTIAASGGSPKQLTSPGTADRNLRVGWPSRLPDGDTVLLSEADSTFDNGRIVAMSLRTGEQRTVVEQGYAARYVASGHLVYALGRSIMAIRFDPHRLRTSGAPVRVVDAIESDRLSGWPGFSLAASGLLLYDPGTDSGDSQQTLEWVARDGSATAVVDERGEYSYPRLSPDGRRLAVGAGNDIWILDLVRGTRNRIAAKDRGTTPAPPISAWTADGRQLAINRRSGSDVRIDVVDPDDVEHSTMLLHRQYLVQLGSWSKDGTLAFFQFPGGGTERDIWVLEPGATEPRPFVASRFNERGETFSPDGHWLTYVADSTGRDEVYVRAYPGPGASVPVSNAGGAEPRWSRNGREIFYRENDRMMAVSFDAGPTVSLGRPRLVFEQRLATSFLGVADYDVAPDGRFVMIRPSNNTIRGRELVAVTNWFEELTARAPAK